jgi:tetratricopeptide (TPR) repeat protein
VNRASHRRVTSIKRTSSFRRQLAAALLCAALAGCASPYLGLALSLIPDGTFTTLLKNMRGVSAPNQQKLAELEAKGDWAGILQFAQENLNRDPNNADWWIIVGYAHSQLKQYQRAADAFQQAVRMEPQDITSWNLLAQAQRSLGQPERAIRTLDNALRINRDSPMTYYLIGESFSDLKRPERAVGFYEEAVQRNPRFPQAVYGLGVCYAQLGRKTDFEATVDLLKKMDPQAAQQLAATPVARR